MSFLAFLVFGGLVGFISAYFHPKKLSKNTSFFKKYGWAVLIGVASSAIASILGQSLKFFQSGQVLEWLSAMVFAIFCVFLFKLGQKWSKNGKKWAKLKKPEISLLFASFRQEKVKRAQIWALFCGYCLFRPQFELNQTSIKHWTRSSAHHHLWQHTLCPRHASCQPLLHRFHP